MEETYKRPPLRNNTKLSDKLVKWFDNRSIRQETLVKLKIGEGPELMHGEKKKRNTVQFNYFLNGELINTKFRTGDKLFKLIGGAELILWNIDAIKGQKECVITEGEIDAMSYIQAGYEYAVSVPNGATGENQALKYLDNYIEEYLDDKEIIYIASDTDNRGLMLRKELIRRLGAERCRIVTYGEGCKDANEHLVKYGTYSLLQTLKNAKEIKVEGIFHISDFEDSLDTLFEKGMQKGVTIGHESFDNLCSFETGRLLTVTGIPSSGKSTFVDYLVERLNMRYGWKVAFFSPENYPLQIHASSLISKITGAKFQVGHIKPNEYKRVKEYMQDNFFFIYPKDSFSLDNILEKAAYLVGKKGIKALVIDPWNRLEYNIPGGMSETNFISHELDKLCAFQQKHDILTILVAHPTKMKRGANGNFDKPTLYDINGSANFFNKTDFGISVHRDKDTHVTEVHVQKVRFRHFGEPGTAFFKFNINNGRYGDAVLQGGEYVCLQWDNTNHLIKNEPEEQDLFDLTPTDEPPPF